MKVPMMTKCGYPDCEKCDNFDGEHCPMTAVITVSLIFAVSERIALMDKTLTELENTVYDEILGADKA